MARRLRWDSRTAFLLAAIGSAVGLGNVWRFPFVAHQNGGGAFLIPFFVAMFTAGIPLLILEFGLGNMMQSGAPAAFAKIAKKIGISAAQLAVLWCKDQPGITAPLMGPVTLEQLEHFLPVLEMELDDETRAACDALVPPGSAVASFHNTADWMKAKII